MFTPQQIEEVSFNRAKFGGYDIASVDAFLEPLTNDYLTLYKENSLLKNKMRILVEKMDELRKSDASSRDAINGTKKTCENMLRETEIRCAKMLADAEAAAEKLTSEASAKHPTASIAAIQEQLNAAVAALELLKEQEVVEEPVREEPLPSIERPWLRFYPEGADRMPVPNVSLSQYLKMTCRGEDLDVLHYYGTNISWKRFNAMVEKTARALRAIGLGEGSQIPVMLQATPEYLALLIAADRIGAALLMRDNTIEENAEAIAKSTATVMFAHDYISQEEVDAYIAAGIEKIITISPMNYAIRPEMPKHVLKNLKARYPKQAPVSDVLESWYDFQDEGDYYEGVVDAEIDPTVPCSTSTPPVPPVLPSRLSILPRLCCLLYVRCPAMPLPTISVLPG